MKKLRRILAGFCTDAVASIRYQKTPLRRRSYIKPKNVSLRGLKDRTGGFLFFGSFCFSTTKFHERIRRINLDKKSFSLRKEGFNKAELKSAEQKLEIMPNELLKSCRFGL